MSAHRQHPHGHHGQADQGPAQSHGPVNLAGVALGPAFGWAVGLNAAYVVIEAVVGLITGSLALLADAAHNLTDVAGLLIAWAAAVLATRAGTARYSWGLGRATILAAMGNAVAILIGVGAVIWQAAGRFWAPVEVPGLTVMIVAGIGIGINAGTAMLFAAARKDDLNARGAFLHMATDAAVSGAVVLAAAGMMATGWLWLDPGVAIAVSLLIAVTAWGLLRDALQLGLDGVPAGVEPAEVAAWIGAQPGVGDVHDLHIWALSTTRTALAVHVVWTGADPARFIGELTDGLEHRFRIAHATVQLEPRRCARAGLCEV